MRRTAHTDYAIVPILAQVEYPTDGSSLDLILPDGVTLLDYHGAPVENAQSLLHSEYSETSAAVLGVYVQADADFTAQLVYTAPDGSALTKTLQVTIDRNAAAGYPFPNSEIAAFAERPTPAVTSGKITKVAKVNGTWLIWFNGEPAYCCTHGANGQPAGCPPYTYVNTSTVNADQCIPGDHYGNQIRIWGGLNQLSLGDADDLPAVFSADEGEEISLLDFCTSIYDDVQMYIIENFPESTAAEIYLASADELLNGVETYASARGYYTYIYNPGRAGWQTVALIGPEIGEEEPEPEPVVQEYYASWEAPAQTASGSFDFSYGVRTDKIQTATLEKVDGATIEIEPITKSGSIDGGSWSISPAGKQTVTTSGHTADDNYQKNGGDAGASWSLHYAVTKTSGTRNGQVGPFTTQEAADAAANSARDAAILTCSFGKDSIATALLALQHGEPLDELVYSEVMFSDTVSGELPEHKRFIYETAIPYFEKRGIPTRVLRGQKTYLDCFYHIVSRGNAEGKLASFPLTGRCSIQRDCKLPPIRTYQKTLPQDTVYYLGIAADEPIRLARLKENQTSLLAKYNLTEKDAWAMCQAEGLLSPLYAFTGRGGCWFCPNASMRELRHLYNAHPDLWQLLLELQDAPNKATERFNRSHTLHDLDLRFSLEGEQLSFYHDLEEER